MEMNYKFVHLIILWLNILGIVLLVGSVVFRWLVLGRALHSVAPSLQERELIEAESQLSLRRLMGVCLILLGVVTCIDLILRTEMMSRKPLSQIIPILPMVLFKTHIGKVLWFKISVIAFSSLTWFFVSQKPRLTVQIFLLLASAGLCLSSSLSGHAADKGIISVWLLADWLHFLAVSSWLGGLFSLIFLFPKISNRIDNQKRLKFESALFSRFSTLAVFSVVTLVLSGLFGAWLRLQTFSNLFSTAYGVTLLFKITFFLPLLALGAINRYYVRPSLKKLAGELVSESWIQQMMTHLISRFGATTGSPDNRRVQSRFGSEQLAMIHLRLFVSVQCLIALLVLGLGTTLTQTSPPNLKPMNVPDNSSSMQHMGM